MVFLPPRRFQPKARNHVLRHRLIHCHRRSQIAGTGVRDPEEIEGCLYSPVFSVHSVQRNENQFRSLTDLQHAFPEKRRAVQFSAFFQCLQIRCIPVKNDFF